MFLNKIYIASREIFELVPTRLMFLEAPLLSGLLV